MLICEFSFSRLRSVERKLPFSLHDWILESMVVTPLATAEVPIFNIFSTPKFTHQHITGMRQFLSRNGNISITKRGRYCYIF